jgi:adenosylhomocysteine nucleosidase
MLGIISALDEELALFKDKATVEQVVRQAGLDFHFALLADRKVILLKSGVGKVNAAVATQVLIDRFGIDAIIFTGIAGSLVPHLKQGDIVISNFVVQHDSVDCFREDEESANRHEYTVDLPCRAQKLN